MKRRQLDIDTTAMSNRAKKLVTSFQQQSCPNYYNVNQ